MERVRARVTWYLLAFISDMYVSCLQVHVSRSEKLFSGQKNKRGEWPNKREKYSLEFPLPGEYAHLATPLLASHLDTPPLCPFLSYKFIRSRRCISIPSDTLNSESQTTESTDWITSLLTLALGFYLETKLYLAITTGK